MLKLDYHPHAKRRMRERRITDAEVRTVLASGAKQLSGLGDDGQDKWVQWAKVNGRMIEVVWWLLDPEADEPELVIVHVRTVIDKSKGW
jgi:hypothetical protein